MTDYFKKIKTTHILPKHDLVFKSPVCDPTFGIPMGDGKNGYLMWFEESRLNININCTDLIDDTGDGDFYTAREDEKHTVCRNGAKFILDFGCPIFDSIYQNEFEARLSLKDAVATIENSTPFAKASISAFASEKHKVAVVSARCQSTDDFSLRSALERWGSRTFMYWYIRYSPDTSTGLSGTDAYVKKNTLCISQQLGKMCFTVAVLPVSEYIAKLTKRNGHHVECETKPSKNLHIDFFITIATGKNAEECESKAFSNLEAAIKKGKEEIFTEHKTAWEEFWNKSFVCLPKTMDFAENLWYLNLYYGNCQMKGKYPPHFCNGIWGFYHDFVPWNLYFHYNSQHNVNSYNAANHPELMETYFNFRKNQLPIARHYASEIKKTKGVFYTDISDLTGRMIADRHELSKNCTCASQIAMLMYKHYLYTGDEKFLREAALPLMKEAGEFYLDMLYADADGRYHITDTTAYEGSPLFKDSITDLVAIRTLFTALSDLLPYEEGKMYKERLTNLVDFTYVQTDTEELHNGKFVSGIGKGENAKGTKVLSVGIPLEDGQLKKGIPARKTFGTPEKNQNSYYGFPDVELSPIYPAGLVGIKDMDTPLYNALYNTMCMHHPALTNENDNVGTEGMCMGWCMMPIYLARMGMADKLKGQLERSISTWIAYPQGFGLYGGYSSPGGKGANTRQSTKDRFIKMDILKIDGEHKKEVIEFNNEFFKDKPEYYSTMNLWNFRHFNSEALPIISNAITEMLVQSYGGIIRLFAAVQKQDTIGFKLACEGGFVLWAEYRQGAFAAVVESRLGNQLNMVFDNTEGEVELKDLSTGQAIEFTRCANMYTMSTSKGMKIFAKTKGYEPNSISYSKQKNNNPKFAGDASLGCKREF